MPYRNMTLEDLAKHIGMDAREVRRLAERGNLPGHMVGGQWRFNRARLLDWLQSSMHSFEVQDRRNLERAMGDEESTTLVSTMLADEAVEMNLPARSKSSVLRELVAVAERTGLVYDARGIVAALEEREELCSTALPDGVALPHPRRPMEYATGEPLIALGRVPAGIPFGAPDGRLTHIFFLVCCPEERLHLRTLARISLMLMRGLKLRLMDAEDTEAALEAIVEIERETMQTGKPA